VPAPARCAVPCRSPKATVSTLSFATVKPLDTQLIRFALTVQGGAMADLRREMRRILKEQLVVIRSGACSAEASSHREAVYDLFVPGYSMVISDAVVEFEHYCNGCCSSFRETLRLTCDEGMQCLCGSGVTALNRSNWTGTSECINSIGLISHVHGLAQQAWMRAVPGRDHKLRGGCQAHAAKATGDAEGGPGQPSISRADDAHDGGDEDVEGGDISVWRQDAETRVKDTQSWILGGTFEDDLLIARIQYGPTETLILNQLALSGVGWEREQQVKFLRDGSRTYQLWEAYRGDPEKRLRDEVADLMCTPALWRTLSNRTEAQGMKLYVLLARMATATYELVEAPHRWWPYKTFASLHDGSVLQELKESRGCTCCLDEFTAGFVEYYGEAVGGSCARAELMALLSAMESDTGSTERRYSWTWRAFLHVQAKGRYITAETAAEMSQAYRNLSADGKSVYEELGELAAKQRAEGHESFPTYRPPQSSRAGAAGRRARQSRALHGGAGRPGGVGPEHDGAPAVELVPAGGGAEEETPPPYGRVLTESRLVLCRERALAAAQEKEERARVTELRDNSRRVVDGEAQSWSFVGGSAACSDVALPRGGLTAEPSPMLVMTWNRSAETVRTAALEHLAKTTLKANGERWQDLHRYIRVQDAPQLGRVPTNRRRCWEAQECICNGSGRFKDQWMDKFLASLRICSRMNGNVRPLPKRGHLVARFGCVNPGRAGPDHPVGDPVPDDVSDVWLHVALFYEKPIRPTYIYMERDPDRDEAGTLGVAPWCGPNSEDLYLVTQWEAFGYMELRPNTKSWTLTWYELVCSPKRLLRPFEPRRQRVRHMGFEPIDLLRRGRAARGRSAAGAEEPQPEAGVSSDSGLSLRRGFSDAEVEPEEVSDGGSEGQDVVGSAELDFAEEHGLFEPVGGATSEESGGAESEDSDHGSIRDVDVEKALQEMEGEAPSGAPAADPVPVEPAAVDPAPLPAASGEDEMPSFELAAELPKAGAKNPPHIVIRVFGYGYEAYLCRRRAVHFLHIPGGGVMQYWFKELAFGGAALLERRSDDGFVADANWLTEFLMQRAAADANDPVLRVGIAAIGVRDQAVAMATAGSARARKRAVSRVAEALAADSDEADGSERSNPEENDDELFPDARQRGRAAVKVLKVDAKPKAKPSGKFRVCGRSGCSKKETADMRFPDASIAACERCYYPWEWAWKEKHPSWPKFCQQPNQEKTLNDQFEVSAECAEDARNKAFDEESVDIVSRCGFRMAHHFRVWKEQPFREATSMPADVEPKDLDLKASSIKFPSGASVDGYVTVNPDKPFVDVDRIEEYFVERRSQSLTEARHVLRDQGKKMFKAEISTLKAKMPTAIRGRTAPPTLGSIAFEAKVKSDGKGGIQPQQHPGGGPFVNQGSRGHAADSAADSLPASVPEDSGSGVAAAGLHDLTRDAAGRGEGAGDSKSQTQGEKDLQGLQVDSSKPPSGKAASSAGGMEALSKPRSPAAVDEMERIRQLETDCDIAKILEGYKLGDREYAVTRFSPKQPNAKDRRDALIEVIETAKQISTHNMHNLRGKNDLKTKYTNELKKNSVNFQSCPKWCRTLVSETLHANLDLDAVWDIINPFAEAEDGPVKFDLACPKLSGVADELDVTINIARDHALNYLLIPIIQNKTNQLDTAKGPRSTLRECVRASLGLPQEIKKFYKDMQVCAAILDTISDHSAEAVASIEVDLADFRKMLHGDYDKEWSSFACALDSDDYWRQEKIEWRRASQGDLQEMENITVTRQSLEGEVSDVTVFTKTVASLMKWFTICRSSTPTPAMHDFFSAAEQFMDRHALLTDEENAPKMDQFNSLLTGLLELDNCSSKGEAREGVTRTFGPRLHRLVERVRELQSQVSKSVSSSANLQALQKAAVVETMSAQAKIVKTELGQLGSVRFSDPPRLSIIFNVVDAMAATACNNIKMDTATDIDDFLVDEVADMLELTTKVCDLAGCDDEEQRINGAARRVKLMTIVLNTTRALKELVQFGNAAEQVSNTEGTKAYQCLKGTVGELKKMRSLMDDQPGGTHGNFISIAQIKNKFGYLLATAAGTTLSFENADIDSTLADATEYQNRLKSIVSFGNVDRGWRAGLDDCAEWTAVVKHARSVVFATKGLAAKVGSAITALEKAITNVRDTCKSYEQDGKCDEIARAMEKTIHLARLTQMEAAAIQKIRDNESSSTEVRATAIQNVLDVLPENGIAQNEFHLAVQKKLNEAMRA
ncbi:unnamed protein product, partial [Prorocentrum cordatum]